MNPLRPQSARPHAEPKAESPPRLRIRVKPSVEALVRGGHPWIYADSVRDQNRPGELGELAVVFDRQDKFLAVGLFDPDSPIRVRLLHVGKPATIDQAWWQARLRATLARRAEVFDSATDGYRLINGESDGWPGLVLDTYANSLVLKIYSGVWLPRLQEVVDLIGHAVRNKRIVLRLSRNIQELAAARFRRRDGTCIQGEPTAEPVVFHENGLAFEADLLRGQKTGFFLDQRENRRRVGALSAGREVLNAFSFSGGFSLYAAVGGAVSVTDIDISAHALAAAERNFALNADIKEVAACRRQAVTADAFAWLEGNPECKFDLVVLDPPSLAKREQEREGAIQAYRKLAASGIRHLRDSGILVAASCSAHVSSAEFFEAVRSAAKASGRPHQEIETTFHAKDHPATFREAEYLKCVYLRF